MKGVTCANVLQQDKNYKKTVLGFPYNLHCILLKSMTAAYAMPRLAVNDTKTAYF